MRVFNKGFIDETNSEIKFMGDKYTEMNLNYLGFKIFKRYDGYIGVNNSLVVGDYRKVKGLKNAIDKVIKDQDHANRVRRNYLKKIK